MNNELIAKLLSLTAESGITLPPGNGSDVILHDADAIITHVEVSDRHGVGKLVQMMFLGEPNILSIRSANYYDGQHELGDLALCIPHTGHSREAVFARVLDAIGRNTVKRILCIPYLADDVRTALALHGIFGAPLCTYIMDDQNVCSDGIPDDLMRELLAKSRLRLAVSPEMYVAYQQKYGCKMSYMPPLAPGRFVPSRLNVPQTDPEMKHGVIIGNIWGQRWVEMLRDTVRGTGVTLTWYCNGEFKWLPCGKDSLIEDSIVPHDPLKDDELVDVLRRAWFAVLPTGMLDESDDRRFITQLSLPSRIPYMMATSHIPILVLGSRRAAAVRFIEQFGIGLVSDYEPRAFTNAVDTLTRRDVNLSMRRKALAAAARFTDVGAAEWIWESLSRGEPMDGRFEDLMPEPRPDVSHLLRPSSSQGF